MLSELHFLGETVSLYDPVKDRRAVYVQINFKCAHRSSAKTQFENIMLTLLESRISLAPKVVEVRILTSVAAVD